MRIKIATLILLLCARPAASQTAEERTARYMESIRDKPGELYAFLRAMPKGGDLHMHLTGSVYAENMIQWLVEDNGCIATLSFTAVAAPCRAVADTIPAATLYRNQTLYDEIVDAWSMRNWNAARQNGHDDFFETFGKFGAATYSRGPDMLAEVMRRAHDNNTLYMEIMQTPQDGASQLAASVGWNADFKTMRDTLLASPQFKAVVQAARDSYAGMVTGQRRLMKCDTPGAEPACNVVIRFVYQIARGSAPEVVFTRIMTAMEAASVDSLVVSFNLVQPEDGYVPMRDYSLHMQMIQYLQRFYPNFPGATLHAGELWAGLVPPEGLRFHIREAVMVAGAKRIGHGVDVMFEDSAAALLKEMARRNVAVEINLSSNAGILGVSGKEHPLRTYLKYGVPVMLSTDDQGVARSDLTMEYVRAVVDQGLTYRQLKRMSRSSLSHAFFTSATRTSVLNQIDVRFAAFERRFQP